MDSDPFRCSASSLSTLREVSSISFFYSSQNDRRSYSIVFFDLKLLTELFCWSFSIVFCSSIWQRIDLMAYPVKTSKTANPTDDIVDEKQTFCGLSPHATILIIVFMNFAHQMPLIGFVVYNACLDRSEKHEPFIFLLMMVLIVSELFLIYGLCTRASNWYTLFIWVTGIICCVLVALIVAVILHFLVAFFVPNLEMYGSSKTILFLCFSFIAFVWNYNAMVVAKCSKEFYTKPLLPTTNND
ncbi:hypothetical protein M3Y96_01010700 [Aphelenchoides besseyi]|nr:hypothetical protein M3Y96_01010700 [Aphelenchoides besseyi]